jgi:hypothetical protein
MTLRDLPVGAFLILEIEKEEAFISTTIKGVERRAAMIHSAMMKFCAGRAN